MKLVFAFFAAIILLPFQISAQTNYKASIVTTKSGQTIQGFIDYREWLSNPASVNFKAGNSTALQIYKPTDISSFEVTGLDAYQAAKVSISKVRIDLQNMADNIDTNTYTATVFLKLLQKGDNVSLLAYTDPIKTRYYISDNQEQSAPQELRYQAYYDHDSRSVKKKNTYYAQLIDLAKKYKGNDADALINQIVTLNYTDDELLKVVKQLNNEDPKKAPIQSSAFPTYHLFAGIGLNATKTSTAEVPSDNGSTDVSKRFVLPEFTFGVSTPFNPTTGKLVFRTELGFLLSKAQTLRYYPEDNYTRITGVSFNQITASLRVQVVNNFYNTDNFKFYAGGGLAINLSRYSNVVITEGRTSTLIAEYNGSATASVAPSNTAWFMPMVRSGFVFNNKIDLTFAYHINIKSFYAANTMFVNTSLIEAGVNYIF
ncbi:hypothetical protein AAFN85_02300 [Mucilaginibacter sp. CAU 1740]|uniref:hypothetical protein n=1 Tax=Mucilaginibacter sp. CAU 1740 TaxID=3140365 RepID=UPI00325B2BBE